MIQAMIICPKTQKAVRSGTVFGNLAAFDATELENNTVRCSACGEQHLVDNSTVKAFPQEMA
jgi:hypothetical protein